MKKIKMSFDNYAKRVKKVCEPDGVLLSQAIQIEYYLISKYNQFKIYVSKDGSMVVGGKKGEEETFFDVGNNKFEKATVPHYSQDIIKNAHIIWWIVK